MNNTELMPAGGWIAHAAPRLVPPPPRERGLLFRGVAQASRWFGRSELPDIFTVLHINPRLFWGWLYFASRLMPFGRLPAALREMIILRTAWNTRSRYEWGQHVDIGLRCGVSDAQIVAVTQGSAAFGDPVERAVMQACDELLRERVIADETWATLRTRYSDRLLIEIVMLVGHYEMVAGFLNTAGLVLEPTIEAKLQAFNKRVSG
ncbi:MAG TPA: carboxymuconolactone decarboxylase family protein [Fontimonas sp.]